MEILRSRYRTHTCNALTESEVGKTAAISGWIHRKRDHGGIVFVDLRDHYGITQVVFPSNLVEAIQKLRIESVIMVKGEVVPRSAETINPKIATGKVEVKCSEFKLLSEAEVLPFQVAEDDNAPELTRLKYRFLDLRREKLHANIVLRSRVINEMRRIMFDLGFLEFQTPILTSSSPEGARDFIVPSRHHPGRFFALPQAPQQFKQLLMVSGFDRYFQIAPCFRDEDPRADRSPGEFYQCDLEMAFVEQEDVFQACEQLFHRTFTKFTKEEVTKPPFPRFKYKEALERFGSDKPDLRIPFEIEDLTEIFKSSSFRVFAEAVSGGGKVRALKVKVPSIPARKYFDDTVAYFTELSGLGLGYVSFEGGNCKGSIAKFFSEQEIKALQTLAGEGTTTFFFAAGADGKILSPLGKLRIKLAADLKLTEEQGYKFCWITDYPMYERDAETGAIGFSHNPFSMPQGGLEALNTKDPLDIVAYQYDVVCNGNELSSGAIRNHLPEVMYRAFEIAGYGKEVVDEKFGGMIRAFKFGAPPHGGMAPGVDRIVMLLAKESAIRDVIAFPMSQTVEDLLMGAPSDVTPKQLKELHILLNLPQPEGGLKGG